MSLTFLQTELSLRTIIEKGLGRPVKLVLTKNSSSMLSARVREGVMHVRLHEMFLAAGADVLNEIIGFIANRRNSLPLFRRFVAENRADIRGKPPQRVSVRTAGRVHDLRELFDEVNREYFGGRISAAITWGAGRTRLWVRKRTLGSYCGTSGLIRINPVLDNNRTPRYFVKYVIYHEMLHADMGIHKIGERRSIHPAEFRRREKLFRDYERATAWERK